jgi:hypothetical protein
MTNEITGEQPERRKVGRPRVHREKPRDDYKEVRVKQAIAGIKPKQFFILEMDFPVVEALVQEYVDRAKKEYDRVSEEIRDAVGGDGPPRDSRGLFVQMMRDIHTAPEAPQEPLEEPEAPPPAPTPEKVRKPLSERGKLTLKAFRKDPAA